MYLPCYFKLPVVALLLLPVDVSVLSGPLALVLCRMSTPARGKPSVQVFGRKVSYLDC